MSKKIEEEIASIDIEKEKEATEKDNNETKKLEFSMEGIIPGTPKTQADKDIFKIFGEAFSDYEERINCQKLPINDLTNKKDLYIEIHSPEKIRPSGLSFSYYQYTIETSPIGYSVLRKLSDFELLNETIPKFNKGKFNPVLWNFPISLADDSEKKLLFLKFYLNSLIEDEYYKSLPIVFEFLSLSQEEWDKKAKVYQKMKEITNIEGMSNITGYFDIKISHEDDFKAMKIKEDIKKKDEIYKKLVDNMNELFPMMEKMSVYLKNISQNFLNLKNLYADGSTYSEALSNSFQQLNIIIKTWGEDYIKQRNFLLNQFKYFFKYIQKEVSSYLKNFEAFEDSKDDYKKKFEKLQKNKSPKQKDQESVKQYRNLYGFYLVNIIEEYNKLNERQGKRVNKQFFLYNKEKEIFFQDYDNFYRLFNFKENYNLPDISISYMGKPNEIFNQLNISKISKNNNDKEEEKEVKEERKSKDEKEEKLENIDFNNRDNDKNEVNIESELKEKENETKENNEENGENEEKKEREEDKENEEEKEKEENNNSDIN